MAVPHASFELMAHQVQTLAWMKEREQQSHHGAKGGVVVLDTGLGKTPLGVAIAKEGSTLIVVPKSLLSNWRDEVRRWAPNHNVIYMHKEFDRKFDRYTHAELKAADIVLTTYDVLLTAARKYDQAKTVCIEGEGRFAGKVMEVVVRRGLIEDERAVGDRALYNIKWRRVICDEAQRFCNYKTKTYRAVMAMYGECRWCLTATPIVNKDVDLWALLRFCGLTRMPAAKHWNHGEYLALKLERLLFKMGYSEANVQLPPRHDLQLIYQFSDLERKAYNIIKAQAVAAYNGMMLGSVDFMHVLAMFTRLRQMCIAPHLICPEAKRGNGDSPRDEQAYRELEEATAGLQSWIHDRYGTAGVKSAKIQALMDKIATIPPGEKFIVFSMFTSALDLVAEALLLRFGQVVGGVEGEEAPPEAERVPAFDVVMIDGDTPMTRRGELVHEFQNDDQVRGLLTGYKTGGVGLNLTRATYVFLLEPWWTPVAMYQAGRRAHRMGQTRECFVYDLAADKSIETQMVLAICKEKTAIADKYLTDEQPGEGAVPGLNRELLGRILFGGDDQ